MKQLLFLAFFAVTIFSSKINLGVTRTTVQNGNWTTPATWNCNCVPSPNDDAIISKVITVNSEVSIHNYSLQSGGTINFQTGGKIKMGL